MTASWAKCWLPLGVLSLAMGCIGQLGCNESPQASSNPETSATSIAQNNADEPMSNGVGERVKPQRESAISAQPGDVRFTQELVVPAATARLKELGTYLTADATTEVPSWVSDRFSSSPLRPSDRNVIYRNNDFVVWRTKQSAVPREQRVGFLQAMAGLRKAFTTPDPHFSLHIYEVAAQGDTITTHAHVELDGPGDNGLVEVDCHWSVSWRQTSDDSSLQLLTIDVDAYEEVHLRRRKPWFADVTASVFRGTDSFTQQMALSNIYWRKRIERHHIIDKSGHHGVTVGDVNGDGLDDIYVCQPGGLPNRLYVQTPDGTVEDLSSAAGCDFLDNTRSALIIDFDNDSHQDLILASVSGILFLKNDGNTRFSLANNIPVIYDAYCLAATDYDNDGDLDVYACRYYRADADRLSLPIPTPYFDAQNGGQNYLIRNDGQWRTSNATAPTGLDQNNNRFSYAAIWIDFDRDGDQDLYVANDFGRNNLYRNETSPSGEVQFTDVALQLGMHDGAFGMAAAGADYDGDGWEDIYVANMFSSAGSRISRMPEFKPELDEEGRGRFQHLARGNTLFRNLSGRGFEDVSVKSGVTMGRWSWGALFTDFDNNGWQDLIVANGYITGDQAQDDL